MEINFNGTVREVCDKLPNEILGEILGKIVADGFDLRGGLRLMPPAYLSKYFSEVFNKYLNAPAADAMQEKQRAYLLNRLEEYENGLS